MRRSLIICLLVATLAVASAHTTRELQSSRELLEGGKFDLSKLDISKLPTLPALGLLPPGVQLPPLKDFLPPLESINLPPLNDFLKSVGLPTWEEMNLPPLSEFMKPVFDPEAVQLPNLQDVLKQANATFVATVKDIVGNIPLPPGVKLPELKLPPLNVDLSRFNLPPLDPAKMPKLPSLEQVVKVMSSLQEGKIPQIQNLDKLIPADLLKNLPPANDVIKTLTPLVETAAKIAKTTDFSKLDMNNLVTPQNLMAVGKVLSNLPKIEGLDKLPSFDQMAKILSVVMPKNNGAAAAAPASLYAG